jgi:GntR family transcriptional repressor for pyruvate dehydrogenase complex
MLGVKLEAVAPRMGLVGDAVQRLEASIRQGMPAGSRLPSEAEIARQLQVSRPVVREALAFLRADGLVESRQGQGLFVADQKVLRIRIGDLNASQEGLLDLLEVRRGVESETARLAAERRTPEDIAVLQTALDAMAKAEAEGRDGVDEDLAFHLAIARISRNQVLIKIIHFWSEPLRDAIAFLRDDDTKTEAIVMTRQDRHAEIFRLIAAGDAEGAHRAMMDHMKETLHRFRSHSAEESNERCRIALAGNNETS